MRESFGGTALFMIVIFFVVIFTGYLCMSINQSKAFAVKNSIIRIIERHGIKRYSAAALENSPGFTNEIAAELNEAGYRSTGVCDADETGFLANGTQANGQNPVFCVKCEGACNGGGDTNPNDKLHYFKVKTFYQFDIPVFNSVFHWTIEGITKSMM